MAVFNHLNNVRPTTKITNAKFPNGQIIRPTMEGGLYLSMLPNISREAHNSEDSQMDFQENYQKEQTLFVLSHTTIYKWYGQ